MAVTAEELLAFEAEVAAAFRERKIRGPVHLSGGNEVQLIELWRDLEISNEDWVFSTYRSHYHALLHGVPRAEVMERVMAGRSMNLSFPRHRFLTSAIVGGCLPIATGVAAAIKRRAGEEWVWCFIGDMAASIGAFFDARRYASGHDLPISFIVEDNGLSCDTPTAACWGAGAREKALRYRYARTWPHVGVGEFIKF